LCPVGVERAPRSADHGNRRFFREVAGFGGPILGLSVGKGFFRTATKYHKYHKIRAMYHVNDGGEAGCPCLCEAVIPAPRRGHTPPRSTRASLPDSATGRAKSRDPCRLVGGDDGSPDWPLRPALGNGLAKRRITGAASGMTACGNWFLSLARPPFATYPVFPGRFRWPTTSETNTLRCFSTIDFPQLRDNRTFSMLSGLFGPAARPWTEGSGRFPGRATYSVLKLLPTFPKRPAMRYDEQTCRWEHFFPHPRCGNANGPPSKKKPPPPPPAKAGPVSRSNMAGLAGGPRANPRFDGRITVNPLRPDTIP